MFFLHFSSGWSAHDGGEGEGGGGEGLGGGGDGDGGEGLGGGGEGGGGGGDGDSGGGEGTGEGGGEGEDGGGLGEGGGGDGEGVACHPGSTVTIVMFRTIEAASAVPRAEESEVCTSSAVMEAGTAMIAVMITLPAVTAMVTSDWSTPAAVATCCCKREMSESE